MWSSFPRSPSCLPYATAIFDRQPQLHQISLASAMPSGVFQGWGGRSWLTSSSSRASFEAQTHESRETRKYVVRNGSACRSLHCCFKEHGIICKSVIGILNICSLSCSCSHLCLCLCLCCSRPRPHAQVVVK
jgi:hypothetical protein